jgi:hypothetical protein
MEKPPWKAPAVMCRAATGHMTVSLGARKNTLFGGLIMYYQYRQESTVHTCIIALLEDSTMLGLPGKVPPHTYSYKSSHTTNSHNSSISLKTTIIKVRNHVHCWKV